MEIWKIIPGYGGCYEASNFGRVRSMDRIIYKKDRHTGSIMIQNYNGRLLSAGTKDRTGHIRVHLGLDKKRLKVYVHRLILEAFVGPCPDGMEGCHNNGIADDNRIENLRWDTHYNNNQDRIKHGTYACGEDHHMARYSNALARNIASCKITRGDALNYYGISSSQFHRIKKGDRVLGENNGD